MSIEAKLNAVYQQIIELKTCYNRDNHIRLLAVSKTFSATDIRLAYQAGQHDFGENYLQEALQKQAQLTDLPLCWHFIGHIQSNKTALISQHFQWVQTLCRLKIAKRLNDQRPENLPPLNVLIQVNISQEPSKDGVHLDEIDSLAKEVMALPRLTLRGLMAIPKATTDVEVQKASFKQLATKYKEGKALYGWDTLSMGMSRDFPVAIEHGSTLVRLGTAIFGSRSKETT